ncbi:divalent-cation tolerance protein CutA [Pseudobacteriovorax antillogorgiicola]|uniref:Divalent cation tolerance protein n=1 Tax=Pseudobacteriovorax antillogorgiicola TaxID=1513793 RepID=A0A1Y6C088_9BACT|nr:divalent-cation tolerance protein CutA [Pseudobacteriovorax antillogorgiicola]TCS52405.1 periplasmic divalent cation tolerance protein [Pseudobacteriovorax antillogorgiicola]SMF28908.1 divalent cation tolerance protein [Pseudobacteriovorax antillogorgiicola]
MIQQFYLKVTVKEMHRLIYITAATTEEATTIARTLVEEKLVACCNLIPQIKSIYHWQGEIQEDSEVLILAKSQENRVSAVISRVTELHSYDCPCITTVSLSEGHPEYLKWVLNQSSGQK